MSKGQCICNSGFILNNENKCVDQNSFFCPYGDNSFYDQVSDKCKCKDGYYFDAKNSQCETGDAWCSVNMSVFSLYNKTSGHCECINGYSWNGSNCVKDIVAIEPVSVNNEIVNKTIENPIIASSTEIVDKNPLKLKSGLIIKSKQSNKIYYVDKNSCLKYIPNQKIAVKNFGKKWASKIKIFDSISNIYQFCDNLK